MTDEAKAMQRLAREQMKRKLLADILADLTICKIEGTDPKEYIQELKQEIDTMFSLFVEKSVYERESNKTDTPRADE